MGRLTLPFAVPVCIVAVFCLPAFGRNGPERFTDVRQHFKFTAELATRMNTLGTGRPWRFSHFRKTNGYAAMPLDGVCLRAPYLHNGSVPTLHDLLKKPEERPVVFWRGYDVYDYGDVGFVHSGPDAEGEGFRYDTSTRGRGTLHAQSSAPQCSAL